MDKPLVTVIIPVYNAGEYLRQCLFSLLAQSELNWQAVAVNDGSTDNSGEILTRMATQDSRIRVITRKNSGVSAARNAGLDAAGGDYIAFLDADDTLAPHCLAALLAAAGQTGAQIIQGLPHAPLRPYYSRGAVNPQAEPGIMARLSPAVWGCLFRSDFIQELPLRFPPGVAFGEDLCFTTLCCARARGIAVATPRRPIYTYRRHRQSATSRYDAPARAMGRMAALGQIAATLNDWGLFGRFEASLEQLFCLHLVLYSAKELYCAGEEDIAAIESFMALHFPKWRQNRAVKALMSPRDRLIYPLITHGRGDALRALYRAKN